MKLRKILTFSLLFVFAALVIARPVYAAGLSFTKGDTISSQEIIEGINWEKFKATSVTDEGETGTQVVNMATIAPGAAKIISWAIPDGDHIKPSTLLAAAADFEATYPDYQVVAAINNDYFGTENNTFQMYNASVIDGVVFRDHSRSSNMYGIAIDEQNNYKLTPVGGQIEVSQNYYLDIYDATNTYVLDTYEIAAVNAAPEEGQTTLIYKNVFTADGYEIIALNTSCDSKILNTMYIEGRHSETIAASTTETVGIATTNVEIVNAIESGRKVRVYKTTAGEWAQYDSVIGCPAQTMRDGTILSPEEISDYGYDHVTLRHPRTSIGFKEDGTMVLMVIDGRQQTDGMYGVSERENALALKQEGCVNSFNFDGGGSSTFAVLIDGKLTVTNSPSDAGGLRNDASHLLVVVPRVKAEYNVEQELTAEGNVKVSGSVDIQPQNGFEYSKAVVLVDGISTGLSPENFELELLPGKEYHLGLAITYHNGVTNTTKGMCYEALNTIGETKELGIPSEPVVSFEKTSIGFVVNIDFEESLESVTKVVLSFDGKSPVVKKTTTGFQVTVASKVEKEYNFSLSYTYRSEICESVTEQIDNIMYTYGSKPVHEHVECSECGLCTSSDCDGTDAEKCQGHEKPAHEHVECPECGLCTSSDCDGTDVDKCQGHEVEEHEHVECPTCGLCISKDCDGIDTDKCPGHKTNGGNTGGGMNCNFGAYVLSMVASLGLVLLVFKKRR